MSTQRSIVIPSNKASISLILYRGFCNEINIMLINVAFKVLIHILLLYTLRQSSSVKICSMYNFGFIISNNHIYNRHEINSRIHLSVLTLRWILDALRLDKFKDAPQRVNGILRSYPGYPLPWI